MGPGTLTAETKGSREVMLYSVVHFMCDLSSEILFRFLFFATLQWVNLSVTFCFDNVSKNYQNINLSKLVDSFADDDFQIFLFCDICSYINNLQIIK